MIDKKQGGYGLLVLMWKRRRTILWIVLLGMVGGVVASFLITPLFKSTATVFPALSNSISHSLLNEYSGGRDDILGIGDSEDAEHLIQMLSSATIRDRIIAKRGLDGPDAYDIPADAKYRRAKLASAWEEHVAIQFTRFGSVTVDVLDKDPQRAADVANDVIALVDTVWIEMERQRAAPGLAMLDRDYEEQLRVMAQTQDSMRVLQRGGVNDYRTQSERFNAELAKAISSGNERAVKALEERIAHVAEKASRYMTLENMLNKSSERLVAIQVLRQKVEGDLMNTMPRKLVVEKATAPDKRATPVRWLVVMMSTFSAFLLAVVLIVVQENLYRLRQA